MVNGNASPATRQKRESKTRNHSKLERPWQHGRFYFKPVIAWRALCANS